MNYRRALDKIHRAIGFEFHHRCFDNVETNELVRFFISNRNNTFYLEIFQSSINSYELGICDLDSEHPHISKLSFRSLKEVCEWIKRYHNKFTCASENIPG